MDSLKVTEFGKALLNNPLLNKGCAFTQKERDELKLNGLLPSHIETSDEQVERCYEQFSQLPSSFAKHQYLAHLQNTNEQLFHLFIGKYLEEMLPLIYTPTVGEACQKFSHIFIAPRGLYLSITLKNEMEEMINNIPLEDVEAIVVTDGERILGLGDLGVGGIGIPIGKLALYSIFGGIHPSKTLPIVLDLGTNNEALLKDPRYLGVKAPRVSGKEYDNFIAEFIRLIKKRYPKVLLQWEDFAKHNAYRLLDKYKDTICSFNDDIQGTAAVTLSAILTAVMARKSSLKEQRFAVLGGGSAGIGICQMLKYALISEGFLESEASNLFYIVDINGLIHSKMNDIDDQQKEFAQDFEKIKGWKVSDLNKITLEDVITHAKPTVLIGVSAQGGAFTESIIRKMANYVDHPAVFPLSNPNSKCEALPQDVIAWTDGKAIIATGSPYPPITHKNTSYKVAQCNNVYIFPGVGLGVIAAQSPKVTQEMFYTAAKTLSSFSPRLKEEEGSLFPSFEDLKFISKAIAIEVYKTAIAEKLVDSCDLKEIEKKVESRMWKAQYPIYSLLK